jgi:hypothetical protein
VYSPTKSFDGESCVEGKVLLVQTKPRPKPLKYGSKGGLEAVDTVVFYYTIIVYPNGRDEGFEAIEDVSSTQLKYRSK